MWLIPLPALWQKIVFCTQMDTHIHWQQRQAGWFNYTPQNISFYTPVEDGTYYETTRGVRAEFSSLSGAYLQNYTSYGYEILWVDRFHQGGVQCTWKVTLASLIFEFLPFVYFHTWILSSAKLQTYISYGYIISWVDRSHQGVLQCTWTVTLAGLIFY